ncbi:PREDICTED: 5'-methylthioadenosine/S-adenosylhomocysteine nucleosidase 1-like [Brassica oleracea var. oleracea]|uniref:5'-methylthioadenosine/S-adenosylhomocysteine nucleosidase 1-like n=1 Tax=Brassica oleracea var. oleracea TaxID=109376 RepID=UPI0006A6BFA2|nr:PREDICTED: 5'-methylthioadenosine/S-adenosylhomocysteine nucleosidase 1-like [Brassica oleracea var. oleracea]
MGSDGDEATDIELEKSLRRPISTVVFVIAMQAEAQPLVNKFGLSDSPPLGVGGKGLPWVVYQGFHKHLRIYVVCPGKESFSRKTSLSRFQGLIVLELFPDILINARTCGAFKL